MGDPWRARRRVGHDPVLQHPGSQPRADELQHLAIHDPLADKRHQGVVVDGAEAVRHVGVEHPVRSLVGLDPDGLDGHMGRALRPEAEARRQEVGLEDGLEDELRRRHDHPVRDGWDPQGPGGSRRAWFGDVHPPKGLRAIGLRLQLSDSPGGRSNVTSLEEHRAARTHTMVRGARHERAMVDDASEPPKPDTAVDQDFDQSGRRESNPRSQLGKLMFCR